MEQKNNEKKVVTRFAPSPTGLLHLGNYRTAIFSYLFAKQHDGKFVLRIEDTDRARSKKEYEDNILESLKWLGLSHDEFYRQSERVERHRFFLEKLISEGKAYISKEESKDGSGEIKEIVRFKNPNKVVAFTDLIRGEIKTNTTDLGDFVIAKNIHEPLFHLAVVVDDMEMGVTHIVRGEDHIPNTPRHILIYEALGGNIPQYAHLPLVLSEDRTKLSKRKGAKPITFYREEGYLPEGILNFLSLVGWNDGTEDEIFTMQDLVERFDLSRVHKAGAIFNVTKLEWVNKEHMKRLAPEVLFAEIERFVPEEIRILSGYSKDALKRIIPIITDKISHFGEMRTMAQEGELAYFFEAQQYLVEGLLWKKNPEKSAAIQHLDSVANILGNLNEGEFEMEKIKAALWDYAEKEGRGDVLWPMRFALSGKDRSPDPFVLASVLGKKETLKRLHDAIALLKK
jgi:glutamyl-tRNA synthetase/nondiscriminating glutamyl-tRNA synthetase